MLNRNQRIACAFAAAFIFALLAACETKTESESAATVPHVAIVQEGSPLPTATAAATASSATTLHATIAPEGPTSTEELIFLSDIVARVRLVSAEAGTRTHTDGRAPDPVFTFRFRVVEYLKGSGNDELTVKLLAENPDGPFAHLHYYSMTPSPTPDADAALRTAKSRFAERDARWDDREALVFLRASSTPGESGVYEFTGRRPGAVSLYNYVVTSEYNKAWLPASAPPGDAVTDAATASSEPQYLTSAPAVQSQSVATDAVADTIPQTASSAISLSKVKSLIEADEDMGEKGNGVPGYEECVAEMFEFDALYKEKENHPRPYIIERHIPSGQPAGHRLWPTPSRHEGTHFYGRWWTTGRDADLFVFRITDDPDNNPTTGYSWEEVTTRPIPEGSYNVFFNDQPPAWVPCDYNPKTGDFRDVRITATAPAGTLHEAFFDPASVGSGGAVGADAANGVLKPAGFAFGGADVSLGSIRWESQAAEMRLSPHARLTNHHADFIALDGSVALRLDFDDATETGEGETRALSWPICAQPWQSGDLLMLRISESPSDLSGVSRDGDCVSATAVPATPTVAPTATPEAATPTPTVTPVPPTATPGTDTPTATAMPTVAPTPEMDTPTPTSMPTVAPTPEMDTPTPAPESDTPTPTVAPIPDTPTPTAAPIPDTPTPTVAPIPDTPTPTP